MSVVIETTIGDLTVDLFLDKRPQTCLNFLKLCKIKYYNLCLFHKIEKHFIAQTGDPSGTGRGGESLFCHLYGEQAKYFDAEFKPRLKHEKKGTLSMVNNGNNMNGSQFFLTLADNLTYLDENHSVFGEVVEGFDVLSKLNDAICDNNNRPYQDIRITHTVVLHDPYDDPSGLEVPDRSPEPSKEMLESGYIRADEEIDDTKGKTAEEIEEKLKDSEAKARATILEMVGDIPDADVKPPENVLFVCKLNPVTTSEDLEVIFSRFGPIVSCEVIKDKKSGESLQYAFIEFEKEEDCENAYFKMDNVLIDDRRIHVDFSQSVSKMTWDRNPVKGSRHQNIVLKDKSKQTDGYDLIFDMGPETSHKSKTKTSSDRNKSSKHKNSSSKDERDFPSYSEDRKSKAGKKDYAYEDRSYKTTKSDKYSDKRDKHRDSYKSYENTKYDKYSEKEERYRYNDKKTKYDKYSEKEERYRYNDKNTKYDKYTEKEEKHNYSEKSYKKPKYDKYSEKEERRKFKECDYKDPRSRSRSKSPEYVSKKHKSSKKKAHYKSVSPDHKKKSRHRH